jgi:hypothetical protein
MQGEFEPGSGTHVRNGVIYASVLGYKRVGSTARAEGGGEADNAGVQPPVATLPCLEVLPSLGSSAHVPSPGDIVTVKASQGLMWLRLPRHTHPRCRVNACV